MSRWKLVPMVPTVDMLDAFRAADSDRFGPDFTTAYRAMLDATPPPAADAVTDAQREAMLDAMCHAENYTPSKPDGTTYSQREYMALLLDAALAARKK